MSFPHLNTICHYFHDVVPLDGHVVIQHKPVSKGVYIPLRRFKFKRLKSIFTVLNDVVMPCGTRKYSIIRRVLFVIDVEGRYLGTVVLVMPNSIMMKTQINIKVFILVTFCPVVVSEIRVYLLSKSLYIHSI
jgi:hypothetical protein